MPDFLDRLKTALADRYAIQEEIGAGGMATVYLAEDLKLHRKVALKVLRPELTAALGPERFLREIEIAAKLHHPHILALHDSGEADGFLYYVMPYVDGESLRDRLNREKQLPVEDALQIAREVADALGSAHRHDVIHRDIKPENILLEEGHAVVADFGIARAIHAAGGEQLTETGMSVGTPAYMSPEQASGGQLDGRSDIYSLGCVLYEMLGGDPPFTGSSAQAILARKSVEPVPSLRVVRETVPEAVELAIMQALAKAPADRFGTARQFSEALRGARVASAEETRLVTRHPSWRNIAAMVMVAALLGGGWWGFNTFRAGPSRIERLAVLPLDNLMRDPEQDYLVDGMTEALTLALGQISALGVISRTSAMQYKGTAKSLPEIAEELNVDAVLEGSVLRLGDTVRVTVQLIRADPEEHLWSAAYDRDMGNVLLLHSDIAQAVAEQIEIALTPQEQSRLASARRVNPEAYTSYLKGMFFANQFTPEALDRAVALLQQAIQLDRGDPLPYAGLASAYRWIGAGHGVMLPREAYPLAKAAAVSALELDETLAEAHAALGWIKLFYDWDWAGAEEAFRRALQLNPNSADAHHGFGTYLTSMGRHDQAIAEIRLAQQLDPLSFIITADVAVRYYAAGRYDEAIAEAREVLQLAPDFAPSLWILGAAYKQKGMYEEAIAAHEHAAGLGPIFRLPLAHTYAVAGREDDARRILAEPDERTTYKFAFHLAWVHAALGEVDKVFHWLEIDYQQRGPWMHWLRIAPHFADLRSDPRFQDLVRRMNFPN